jgi:Bacterial lectin
MRAVTFCCLCLWLMATSGLAQPFSLLGTATDNGYGCVILTPDEPYAQGLAWSERPLDLRQPFTIAFDIFLGERDEGADGIAFVIQADVRGLEAYGTYGECISYGTWDRRYPGGTYIAPSVAVEFDTYSNPRQGDPPQDHAAYLEDGSSRHASYYSPTPAYNLEDGRLHAFSVQWEPTTQQLTVRLDGIIMHEATRDLLGGIFGGQPEVYWGFTASTGNHHNLQYFCLRSLVMQ